MEESNIWKISFNQLYMGKVKYWFSYSLHGECTMGIKQWGISWNLSKQRGGHISFTCRKGSITIKAYNTSKPCITARLVSLFCTSQMAKLGFVPEYCNLWHWLQVLQEPLRLRITLKWVKAILIIPFCLLE